MINTMKIKSFFFLILFVLGSKIIVGQQVLRLDLEDAKQYAQEYNKTLMNAGLAVDEAQAALKETIAQGLPQVNATVDYSNFFGSKASFGSFPGMEIEFVPTSNLSLSVGQLIFNGSYIVGIQTAKLFKEITETSLEKTELEINAQVTQAYYLALITQKSKDIVLSNLENMNGLLDKTKAMVAVGIAEELDYDQLLVQSSMLSNALKAAERQLELSLNMLRLQMGLSGDVGIELTDKLESIVENSDFRLSLSEPFNLQSHLDFQLMSLQADIAQKQINMEKSNYLPTISGFYNYTEKLLKPELDITPKHVIGLNMNIPIFASGSKRSRVNQAKIRLEIAENQMDLLSQQLDIQEKQLRYNLNNALEQFESQEANMAVAKRVFENISNKFQQGMLSSLDLITANNNYLQAENNYIMALMQLLEAQLEMDKLLHKL